MKEIVQNNSPTWFETVDYCIARDNGKRNLDNQSPINKWGYFLHNFPNTDKSVFVSFNIKVFFSFYVYFKMGSVEFLISQNANLESQIPLLELRRPSPGLDLVKSSSNRQTQKR